MPSATERAQEFLEAQIFGGELCAGAEVVGQTLMKILKAKWGESLKLSRTPLHDALVRLEVTGLLERSGNSLRVVALSDPEFREIIDMRWTLEGESVVKLAKMADGMARFDMLQDLNRANTRMERALKRLKYESGPNREEVLREFVAADIEFHCAILRWGKGKKSEATIHPLLEQLAVKMIEKNRDKGIMEEVLEQHWKIVGLVAGQKSELAREAVTAHLLSTRDRAKVAVRFDWEKENKASAANGG